MKEKLGVRIAQLHQERESKSRSDWKVATAGEIIRKNTKKKNKIRNFVRIKLF